VIYYDKLVLIAEELLDDLSSLFYVFAIWRIYTSLHQYSSLSVFIANVGKRNITSTVPRVNLFSCGSRNRMKAHDN
jgi:hypothetical protein